MLQQPQARAATQWDDGRETGSYSLSKIAIS
jgi:hypothetical protein